MKKFIFIMLMMLSVFTVSSSAQTYYYRTYQYAHASIYNNAYHWSDWMKSNLAVTINFDTDQVIIYSANTQTYQLLLSGDWESDGEGGKQIHMKFVDQDGDQGTMSLRIEHSGNSQLYVRFSNIAWVYNLRRIY